MTLSTTFRAYFVVLNLKVLIAYLRCSSHLSSGCCSRAGAAAGILHLILLGFGEVVMPVLVLLGVRRKRIKKQDSRNEAVQDSSKSERQNKKDAKIEKIYG